MSDLREEVEMLDKGFSVWVGQTEMNAYPLDREKAGELAEVFRSVGYKDVEIRQWGETR